MIGSHFVGEVFIGGSGLPRGTIESPVATITVQAINPTMSGGSKLVIPTAQITVTGIAPIFAAAAGLFPPTAQITVTGVAPEITAGGSLIVPTARVVVSAVSPIFSSGASFVVPTATVNIKAIDPIFSGGGSIISPTAQVTVNAIAPELYAGGGALHPPTARVIVRAVGPLMELFGVPDIVATRDDTTITVEVLNRQGQKVRLFKADDIRGLHEQLADFVADTYIDEAVDADIDYTYKAQFILGTGENIRKTAKSKRKYAKSENNIL